jgi:flagellar protein FlaG
MSIQLVATLPGPPPASSLGKHPSDSVNVNPAKTSAEKSNESPEPSTKDLKEALDVIEQAIRTTTDELNFSIDEESGRTVVKVIDKTTDEVIRQFPSKEVLDIARALDKLQGMLIKEKA